MPKCTIFKMTQINKKQLKNLGIFTFGQAWPGSPPPPGTASGFRDFVTIAFAQPVPGNRGMLAQIGCVEIGTRCI